MACLMPTHSQTSMSLQLLPATCRHMIRFHLHLLIWNCPMDPYKPEKVAVLYFPSKMLCHKTARHTNQYLGFHPCTEIGRRCSSSTGHWSLDHYAPAVRVHGSSSWFSSFQPCCSESALAFPLGTMQLSPMYMNKVTVSNGCP